MKKNLFLVLVLSIAIFSACKKEYATPVVTEPASTTLEVGKSVDLTFSFSAEGGYKSSAVTATGGTAVIKTDATAEAASGNIVITFTAGSTVGAGAVVLTVTDNEGQTESATAVLSLFEKGAPAVTAPASTDVTVMKPVDVTFSYTAEGGFKSAAVTATNGTATIKTNGTAGANSGNIVVTFTASRTVGAGSVALTVTDNNNKSGISTGVLDVKMVTTISVTENISENTTWETGKIYILEGRITVLSGKTLTIQPGVIVKGREGSSSNATALMIARGGKLDAQGTATSPIIFTSVADQILPGEIASPNLAATLNGLWGGLLILGNAPISAASASMQIEGIPVSDDNGLYGGTDPADNSGTIKYVSIRHGGANIGEGNEINGLTLGGVGSGTTIENVEIIANQDDGIEWFGGTVTVKNAIIWNAGDDAVDTDQAWSGTLDNFVVVNPGDECFELDGPEGTATGSHTLKNGSVKADNASGLADLDDNSAVTMTGIYFFGIKAGQDFDDNPTGGGLVASSLEATIPAGTALSAYFKEGTDAFVTSVTTRTVGATVSVFNTWSWASTSGALSGF